MSSKTLLVCSISLIALACAALGGDGPGVAVSVDSIRQRYPWNGKVDVDFTVRCTDPQKWVLLRFSATDATASPATNLVALSFDGTHTNCFAATCGVYRVTWDTDVDVPKSVIEAVDFKIMATADYPEKDSDRYVIIDLSEGYGASTFPVYKLPALPLGGLNTPEYKTTKMAFVKIPATTSDEWKAISGGKDYFVMGSPANEPGRMAGTANTWETQHNVKLTRSFHMSIFETTQKQMFLFANWRPSRCYGDMRPVDYASYEQLRGSVSDGIDWPNTRASDDPEKADPFRVGNFSKIQELRKRTNLMFDFPTEAEWEYACRAGTTTARYNGKDIVVEGNQDRALDQIACYRYVNGKDRKGKEPDGTASDPEVTHSNIVGSYAPNPWGLYDMLGNVFEFCRDWRTTITSTATVTDPWGADAGTTRVFKGGSWGSGATDTRVANRTSGNPSDKNCYAGFRLALYLDE